MISKPEYSIAFDASTTNVGITVWNENGEMITMKHLELKIDKSVPPEDREIVKADMFKKFIIDYKREVENQYNCKIIRSIIEAPLENSSININTTALLLSFNGIIRYILYEIFNVIPLKISVYDSRKIFCNELVKTTKVKGEIKETLSFPEEYRDNKKQYILEKVTRLHPDFEWKFNRNGKLDASNFDLSDSYCVGYSALVILGIIKP